MANNTEDEDDHSTATSPAARSKAGTNSTRRKKEIFNK